MTTVADLANKFANQAQVATGSPSMNASIAALGAAASKRRNSIQVLEDDGRDDVPQHLPRMSDSHDIYAPRMSNGAPLPGFSKLNRTPFESKDASPASSSTSLSRRKSSQNYEHSSARAEGGAQSQEARRSSALPLPENAEVGSIATGAEAKAPGRLDVRRLSISKIIVPGSMGKARKNSLSGGNARTPARMAFDKYDPDATGHISGDDYRELCYDFGYFLSDDELIKETTAVQATHGGEIGYEDFMTWWRTDERFKILQDLEFNTHLALRQIIPAFQAADNNTDGALDPDEFEPFYAELLKKDFVVMPFSAALAALGLKPSDKVEFNAFIPWAITELTKRAAVQAQQAA